MPGWALRSFARKTEFASAYEFQKFRNWRLKVFAEVATNDREQNGGLIDSSYSILQNDQGEFSLINGDIILENAFNKSTDLTLGFENEVHFVRGKRASLSFVNKNEYHVSKYIYRDLRPDTVYYKVFGRTDLKAVDDSLRYRQFSGDLAARIVLNPDSAFTNELSVGVKISSGNLHNNGQSLYVLNQMAHADFEGNFSRFLYALGAMKYFNGYNSGDLKLNARIGFDLSQSKEDSSNAGTTMEVYAKAFELSSRPALIYERYYSEVDTVAGNFQKIASNAYEVGFTRKASRFSFIARTGIEKRNNHVFYAADGSLNQSNEQLSLMYSGLNFTLHFKHFFVANDLTYQWNDRSKVYSVPDWINSSQVATMWPLFRKKLGISLGGKSFYYSPYYARGYFPHLNVMYVQATKRYTDYLQLDAFINIQVKSVNVDFSVINFSHGFFNDEALIAPNYPQVPRHIMLTIDWTFRN